MANHDHIDAIIQYALAVSRCSQDWQLRELGPIHFIKYVYLVDLEHAQKRGDTFTGAPWQFFNFGPWAPVVNDRVEPALQAIGATRRELSGPHGDFTRWTIDSEEAARGLKAKLERTLPVPVTITVARWVREHGSATGDLLRDVYLTRPMVQARPGEMLQFEPLPVATPRPATKTTPVKKSKGDSKVLAEIQRRVKEKARSRIQQRKAPVRPAPRYDDVYRDGVEWLDSLAGHSLSGTEGTLEFDDAIWSSSIRRGEDVE